MNNSRDHNKSVVIKELSLSGALIQGLPDCSEVVRIKPELPNGKKIELKGQIVRVEKDVSVVELHQLDMATMETLWGNIREKVSFQSNCPYCGAENNNDSSQCCDCSLPFNFEDKNYLKKHFKDTFLDRIKIRTDKLDSDHLEKIIKFIDKEISRGKGQPTDEEFVGTSPAMLEVFSMIRKVAPTNVNVLILGESGTGKELTAKAIHERSPRKEKPFLAINSAAIPEGLLEAELFGFEKGAFTGAHAPRKGKFEQADGGTLFLDEIGDLPTGLQAKLLRFLEDRVVERIGAKGGKKVDVRIITATNCKLEEMIQKGVFRNDLFYRLDGFTIKLPALRNRGEDKIILAQYILKKISQSENSPHRSFSTETIETIKAYDWPGNVRELINKIRRGHLMAVESEIQPEDIDLHNVRTEVEKGTMHTEIATTQKKLVEKTLQDHNFIITRSAKALGISRPSLYALMKKYNISKTEHNASTTF
jgi:transcriptional regulator with PAS, ATPase and Fis domain